jgi:hypothetical protein
MPTPRVTAVIRDKEISLRRSPAHHRHAAVGSHARRARTPTGSSHGIPGRRLVALFLNLLVAVSLCLAAAATVAAALHVPSVDAADGGPSRQTVSAPPAGSPPPARGTGGGGAGASAGGPVSGEFPDQGGRPESEHPLATVPKYSHLRLREDQEVGSAQSAERGGGEDDPLGEGGRRATEPVQVAYHGRLQGTAAPAMNRSRLRASDRAVQRAEQKQVAASVRTPVAVPERGSPARQVNWAELDTAQTTRGQRYVSPVVPAMEGMEPTFAEAGAPPLVAPGLKGLWLAVEADEPVLGALQPADTLASAAGLPPVAGAVPEAVYHGVTAEPAAGAVKLGQPLAATLGVPVVAGALPEAAYLGTREGKEVQAGMSLVAPSLASAGVSSVAAGLPALAYYAEQTEMGAGAMLPALAVGGPWAAAAVVVVPGVLQLAADILPESIDGPVRAVADAATDAVKWVGDRVEDGLDLVGLKEPVADAWHGVLDGLGTVGEGLGDAGEAFADGVPEAADTVGDAFVDAGEAVGKGFEDFGEALGGLFG